MGLAQDTIQSDLQIMSVHYREDRLEKLMIMPGDPKCVTSPRNDAASFSPNVFGGT